MKAAAKIFNRRRVISNKERSLNFPNYQNNSTLLYNTSTLTIIDHITTIKKDFRKIAYMGNDPVFFLHNLPESKNKEKKN